MMLCYPFFLSSRNKINKNKNKNEKIKNKSSLLVLILTIILEKRRQKHLNTLLEN